MKKTLSLLLLSVLLILAFSTAAAQEPEYKNQWVPEIRWYRILEVGENVMVKTDNGTTKIIAFGSAPEIYTAYPKIFGLYIEPTAVELENLYLTDYMDPEIPDTQDVDHPTFACNVFEVEILGPQNIRYKIRGADLGESGRMEGAYMIYNGVAWPEFDDVPGIHCYASRGYMVVFGTVAHNHEIIK